MIRIFSSAAVAVLTLVGSPAKAEIYPTIFPDVRELVLDWTVTLPERRSDGLEYNTRMDFKPVGGKPVTRWQVVIECEKTNTTTRHFEIKGDEGTAEIRGGKMVLTFPELGSGTMELKEPMRVTMADKRCGSGVPWIAPSENFGTPSP